MWWRKKWGSDKICGITHSRIRPGCSKSGLPYSVKLSCGHCFYTNPLIEWVKTGNQSCPLCRKNIDIFKEILGDKCISYEEDLEED